MREFKFGILILGLIVLITGCDNEPVSVDRIEENPASSTNNEQIIVSQEVTGAVPVSSDKATDKAIIKRETNQREVEMTEPLELRDRDRAEIENEKLGMPPSTKEML